MLFRRPSSVVRRPSSVVVAIVMSAGTSACDPSDTAIVPEPPELADLICVPKDVAYYDASVPGIPDANLGRAVEVLSIGSAPYGLNTQRYVIAGAPGPEDDEKEGFADVRLASRIYGDIAYPHTATQHLTSDDGDAARGYIDTTWSYGRAVFATDVVGCHEVSSGPPMPLYEGCGEELLIGAPDTFVHDGAGYFDVWKQTSNSNGVLEWAARVTPPYQVDYAGAEFGYSFAVPPAAVDADAPWDVADDACPPWVAVGAPGEETVVVYYNLDCSDVANPFDTADYLLFSGGGEGYGRVLAAGDVDGDGDPDLVIGAPGGAGDTTGEVQVVRGDPYDAVPNWAAGTSHLFIDYGSTTLEPTTPDRFGEAIAIGPVAFGQAYSPVIIGAPGYSIVAPNAGLVCQFDIDTISETAVANDHCFATPGYDENAALTEGFEFGAAVKVGNFVSIDSRGSEDTPSRDHVEPTA